eukprot:COSAG03_NODE_1059_length_4930_cov_437.439661_3_plen_68_part_00
MRSDRTRSCHGGVKSKQSIENLSHPVKISDIHLTCITIQYLRVECPGIAGNFVTENGSDFHQFYNPQ